MITTAKRNIGTLLYKIENYCQRTKLHTSLRDLLLWILNLPALAVVVVADVSEMEYGAAPTNLESLVDTFVTGSRES